MTYRPSIRRRSNGGHSPKGTTLPERSCLPWPSDEFAGMAEELQELADRLAQQAQLAASLTASLASRSVIDQAIGVIMSQSRCDAEEAFDVLRRASNNRNVKLRDIAAEIVTAVRDQPPDPTCRCDP